jgi:hypothetical protein
MGIGQVGLVGTLFRQWVTCVGSCLSGNDITSQPFFFFLEPGRLKQVDRQGIFGTSGIDASLFGCSLPSHAALLPYSSVDSI